LEDGPWKVEDGTIYFDHNDISFPALAWLGKRIPADFELRFEWKESPKFKSSLQGHFAIGTHGAMTEDGWSGWLFCDYWAGERGVRLVTDRARVPVKFTGVSRSKAPNIDVARPAGEWNQGDCAIIGNLA
jgi:hypothetical protein